MERSRRDLPKSHVWLGALTPSLRFWRKMAKKFVPRGCGMLRNASLGCVLCCEIGPRGSWCVSVIGPGGVWCVSSLIMSTQVLCGSSFRELPTPIRVFGDKLLRIGVQIIFADSKKKNTRQKNARAWSRGVVGEGQNRQQHSSDTPCLEVFRGRLVDAKLYNIQGRATRLPERLSLATLSANLSASSWRVLGSSFLSTTVSVG